MLINKVSYTDKIWFLSHTKNFTRIYFHNMSPMMILYLYAKNQKILPIEYWENPQKLHFWAVFSPNLPKKIFFFKSWSCQFELFAVWPLKNQRKQMSQCREKLMVWFWSWYLGDFGTCQSFSHNFCSPWRKNWLYPSFKSW